MKPISRITPYVLPLLLLFGVFTVYLSTLPASIGYGDAGLLAAAATTLGVPHPPGFPSYMMIAHLFTKLPFGTLLFRLELVSLVSSLILITLIFSYLKKATGTLPAFLSSFALATSYNFWTQSLNVESFILTNLVIVAVMIMAEQSDYGIKTSLLLGTLFGVGLGLNPIVIAVIPSLLYSSFARPGLAKLFLGSCVATIIFIITYSYLPFRAATHPFINWSAPSTLDRIVSHISGGGLSIASGTVANGFTGSFRWYIDAWLRFFVLLAQNFTLVLIPIMLLGGYTMWLKNKKIAVSWGILIFTNISLAGLYISGNRDNWYITSFIALSLFLSHGIYFMFDLIKTQSNTMRMLTYTYIVLSCIAPLIMWYPTMRNRVKDTISYTYINDIYYKLPNNALLIGGGETFNSLTAYAHEVLKFRTDVTPIDFTIYYGKQWYRDTIGYVTLDPRVGSTLLTILSLSKDREDDKKKSKDEKKGQGMTDAIDMPTFTDEMEFSRILEQFARANADKRIFVTGYLLTQPIYANSITPAYVPQTYALRQHGIVYELVDPSFERAHEILASSSASFYTTFLEENYTKAVRDIRREYALALEKEGDRKLEQNDKTGAFILYDKAGGMAPEYFDQNRLREKMAIPASASSVPKER
ncbi:DUF2723 domain-containing protein [Candidatus Gottesmanbacteria bacterium]|nr:DUF2723 domain-containing protein [Candidatus Gottesmanbacteria bacterium]